MSVAGDLKVAMADPASLPSAVSNALCRIATRVPAISRVAARVTFVCEPLRFLR